MIRFYRQSLQERLKRRLFPRYREQREEELRRAIRWLVDHPEAPCEIEGQYIPDGFGEGAQFDAATGIRLLGLLGDVRREPEKP